MRPMPTGRRRARQLSDLAREAVDLCRARSDATPISRSAPRRWPGCWSAGYGYRGDAETYDDLANANLIRVIERRKGLPVALGVMWLHAARAAGWAAHGVDFPAHFLVALEGSGQPGRCSTCSTAARRSTRAICARC